MTTINEQEVLALIERLRDERRNKSYDMAMDGLDAASMLTALLEENKRLRELTVSSEEVFRRVWEGPKVEPVGMEPFGWIWRDRDHIDGWSGWFYTPKQPPKENSFAFEKQPCFSAAQLSSVIAERNAYKADAENYKQKLADTLTLLNEVMEQREAYRKDAERYAWLQGALFTDDCGGLCIKPNRFVENPECEMLEGSALDTAIDAAMKKENE